LRHIAFQTVAEKTKKSEKNLKKHLPITYLSIEVKKSITIQALKLNGNTLNIYES